MIALSQIEYSTVTATIDKPQLPGPVRVGRSRQSTSYGVGSGKGS